MDIIKRIAGDPIPQERVFEVDEIAEPLAQRMLEVYGLDVPVVEIRQNLLFAAGYPIVGNRSPRSAEQRIAGNSGNNPGVVNGEIVVYRGRSEDVEYPIIHPEDDDVTRSRKIQRERELLNRAFSQVFNFAYAIQHVEIYSLLMSVQDYIMERIAQERRIAYRLIQDFIALSDEEIVAALGLQSEDTSAPELADLRTELRDSFIPVLIRSRELAPIDERFEILRSIYSIILNNPVGSEIDLFEQLAREFVLALRALEEAEGADAVALRAANQRLEQITQDLVAVRARIAAEENFADVQRGTIIGQFLRDALQNMSQAEEVVSAHEVIRQGEETGEMYLQAMEASRVNNQNEASRELLEKNIANIREQVQVLRVIESRLHSRQYVTDATDDEETIERKKQEQIDRFNEAFERVKRVICFKTSSKTRLRRRPSN